LGWRTLLTVAVVAAAVVAVVLTPVRLGLDLRGGMQVVLEARAAAERPVDSDTVDRMLKVLRRRVDALGVAEPSLQRSGERRIIVELPGVTDPDEALQVIGRTAQLTFHPVTGVAPSGATEGEVSSAVDEPLMLRDEDGTLLELGPAALDGNDIDGAQAALADQLGVSWQVQLDFRGEGQARWQGLTAEAACASPGDPARRVAIVLDGEVISSPQVAPEVGCGQGIAGGKTSITGQFTEEEARDLALLVRAGALPVPVDVVEQRTIGPTLGAAAIDASALAAGIGVTLTIMFMLAAYRLFGAVAGIALGVYGLLAFAALVTIGATLTLPGIAGFVLAVGMAVDANVLVFERAKEEFAAGRSPRGAAATGFKKALSAVVDSNVTTLIAGGLLIFLASGAVRGFGVTVSIGVIVSMFSALVVARVMVEWMLRGPGLARRPELLGLTAWARLRQWLTERNPDLMGRTRWWLVISGAAVVLAVAGTAVQGISWGLEFTGGRLLVYRTEHTVDLDELRGALADAGLPRAVVQLTAEGQVAVRAGALSGNQQAEISAAVTAAGGQAEVVRDEFIGPTIGAELRRNALIALGVALTAQLLYLAVRFRWTYGIAMVVAMFHDAMILVGVFVWLHKDLDGVFLAAVLTVVGYSVNDSVVIFDRVREQRELNPRQPLDRITNDACVQTLPRTVNTGMGALFILLALFVLGGDTLADFALALLIGTTVGMYSSVLVGSPLFLLLEGAPPGRRDKPGAPGLRRRAHAGSRPG
jgi:SecD/SecF fusion protein